jgi:rod shape-determining protein MreD
MRPLPWLILAYLAVAVQAGMEAFVLVKGVRPSLPLVAMTFVAMNLATARGGPIVPCVGIGFLFDLFSSAPLGMYALAFGLAAAFVGNLTRALQPDHPVMYGILTLLAGLVVAVVAGLNGWWRADEVGRLWPEVGTAVYSGLIAVPLVAMLQRGKRLFGFEPTRVPGTGLRL